MSKPVLPNDLDELNRMYDQNTRDINALKNRIVAFEYLNKEIENKKREIALADTKAKLLANAHTNVVMATRNLSEAQELELAIEQSLKSVQEQEKEKEEIDLAKALSIVTHQEDLEVTNRSLIDHFAKAKYDNSYINTPSILNNLVNRLIAEDTNSKHKRIIQSENLSDKADVITYPDDGSYSYGSSIIGKIIDGQDYQVSGPMCLLIAVTSDPNFKSIYRISPLRLYVDMCNKGHKFHSGKMCEMFNVLFLSIYYGIDFNIKMIGNICSPVTKLVTGQSTCYEIINDLYINSSYILVRDDPHNKNKILTDNVYEIFKNVSPNYITNRVSNFTIYLTLQNQHYTCGH